MSYIYRITSKLNNDIEMNKQNASFLYLNYPILYKNECGFDCGDGWFDLLNDLSLKLEFINGSTDSSKVVALQVKEKFGGLRFYVESGTNEILQLIDEAEAKSLMTCEECGNDGSLRKGIWWRTLCDACDEKRKQ